MQQYVINNAGQILTFKDVFVCDVLKIANRNERKWRTVPTTATAQGNRRSTVAADFTGIPGGEYSFAAIDAGGILRAAGLVFVNIDETNTTAEQYDTDGENTILQYGE